MGAVAYPVEGVLHRDGVEVGERPSAVLVAVRPEAVVVDVGVLLADRAEGALSAGIAQGIDEPTISLLIVGLLANVIFLTFIAAIVGREVGLWETLPVVTAIVWALTTGFSLLLHLNQSQSGIYIDTGLGSAANTVIPANAGIQGTVQNVLFWTPA